MVDKFSKIGFILAVVGGAVGLGNAWKFPTMVGQNGGFAFVLLYLLLTLTLGFSIFLAEIAMGRLSQKDPVNAYRNLAPRNKETWKFAGFFMIGGIFVLSFYLVILGWVTRYVFIGFDTLPSEISQAGKIFDDLVSNDLTTSFFFYFIAFFSTLAVVSRGVKSGIEKLNIIMMPTLFILLIVMLCFAATKSGFGKAFEFLFIPNFDKLNLNSILEALGLAFFTLCLGIGCITTYSASLKDDTNLVKSSINIILINIAIGLMMGLIVFTFVFEFGSDPTQSGPGLVFVSLTTLFAKLGTMGNLLAILFFISLFFAGITSAVSMIEPFVFYLVNEYQISRFKAIFFSGIAIVILSSFCILSMSAKFGAYFSPFGKDFLTILDYLASNLMLPLGAIITAIFVGFIMKKEQLLSLFGNYMGNFGFECWYLFLRYVAPFGVIAIMINQILKSLGA